LIGSWRRIRGGRRNSSTSRRIFERLRDEYGYGSGITIVSVYVHEQRQRLREMFVPLRHDLGHAQVDFGEALAVIAGEERKNHFFAMDLPHSDACLAQAYPAETTEAFCEGHNIGFEFFGGVPRSILYDNTKLAVARILGYGRRHSARGPSTSCSRTICSPITSGSRATAATKARSKGWSATRGATCSCRSRR
jgi:transposase